MSLSIRRVVMPSKNIVLLFRLVDLQTLDYSYIFFSFKFFSRFQILIIFNVFFCFHVIFVVVNK